MDHHYMYSSGSFNSQKHLSSSMDDIEAGGCDSHVQSYYTIDKLLEDVENIKEDFSIVEAIVRGLQQCNAEGKKQEGPRPIKEIRARMCSDLENLLRLVKSIKKKLDIIERSNAAQRKLPGCEPGSSVDNTRLSVIAGLGKRMEKIRDDFQEFRSRIAADYKEVVENRYFTITGEDPGLEFIENLISGEEIGVIMNKASVQGKGGDQVIETVAEIQERRGALDAVDQDLMGLHGIFMEMVILLQVQGCKQAKNNEALKMGPGGVSNVFERGPWIEPGKTSDYEEEMKRKAYVSMFIAVIFVVFLIIPLAIVEERLSED